MDKELRIWITLLPDQRDQRIDIGLDTVKFAPYDHTLLGAIAVTVLYYYMNIDICHFTIWTGDMKLSRLNGKLLFHKRVFHSYILSLFILLCKVRVINQTPTIYPAEA
jgi:hypothetical protein